MLVRSGIAHAYRKCFGAKHLHLSSACAVDLLGLAKSVAGCDRAIIQTGFEPVHTLLGRAMREGFRTDMACGHFLQAVITDGSRSTQRRLDVAAFEQAALLSGMRPHARETIGLEFQLH